MASTSASASAFDSALKYAYAVKNHLCNEARAVPWTGLWKLLLVFELVKTSQDKLVEECSALLKQQDTLSAPQKADIALIVESHAQTRAYHFTLALAWRRHATWRHLHAYPADIQEALHLHERYFSTPDKRHSIDDNAIFKKLEAEELEGLERSSANVKARLDALRNWLEDHPSARRILKGRKGKGKRVDDEAENDELVLAEAAHFKEVLQEIEPTKTLQDLVEYTKEWLEAFVCRVNVVKEATRSVQLARNKPSRVPKPTEAYPSAQPSAQEVQVFQTVTSTATALTPSLAIPTASPEEGILADEAPPRQDQAVGPDEPQLSRTKSSSRRKTMDRGTSPLGLHEQRSPSPILPRPAIGEVAQDTQASSTQNTTSTNSTQGASFRSEGHLYSPDSLPSRPTSPAPGQNRMPVPTYRHVDPPVSSRESHPISSKRDSELDLPPLHSSNPSDEVRLHTDLALPTASQTDNTLFLEQEEVEESRGAKRLRVPSADAETDVLQLSFTPAMQARFAARAAQVEKERLRLRALEEDPPKSSWANLQFYIPPDRLFLSKPIIQETSREHDSDGSHDGRATSVPATFASLGSGSEAGSLDEEEKSITSFLHREKTEDGMLL